MHFSIDRTVHTTAFDKPVVDHWLERKIAQTAAGSTEKDRSDDRPLQRQARYRLSYILLLPTVQNPAVVTEKGKKQVDAITSAERGELVTVVYTVSAIGSVVPPLFIFPRVHYKAHFIREGPTQCIGTATRSGWMNEETFVEYLNHIIKHTGCSPEKKILLILDNHDTHSRRIDPSWGGPIEIFLVTASAPRLV